MYVCFGFASYIFTEYTENLQLKLTENIHKNTCIF